MKTFFYFLGIWMIVQTMCSNSDAQIVTTFAGNGIQGFSGDSVNADSAELYYPFGMAFDDTGNLYIADAGNQRIRKVSTSGIITTIAGNGIYGYSGDGGLATLAQLNFPQAVAFDKIGNLFIADRLNGCIRKVTPSGIITTVAGNDTIGYTGDGGPATKAELCQPLALAVDKIGNIYIAGECSDVIRKVDTFGNINLFAGNGTGYGGDGGPATEAQLFGPKGVAVDDDGNVYIADFENSCIRKVNTAGIISTIAGNAGSGYSGDGGLATEAMLNHPYGVTVDKSGNLYITDAGNWRVRKVNSLGIISTFAGIGTEGYGGDGGLAIDAEFVQPYAVAFADNSSIYISDDLNNRVRLVSAVTGVNQIESAPTLDVYPNPSNGFFTLNIPATTDKSTVTIFDLYGKIIRNKDFDMHGNISLNFDNMPQGTYLIKFQSSNSSIVQKIVVD